MFDPTKSDLIEIQPIVDIVDDPEEETRPDTPPPLKQNEIFSLPTSVVKKYGLDKIKPAKKRVGQRGKDKKPRAKNPPTEKQLIHLAKMRAAAAEKRTAKAFAKRQKLEEAKKIVEERRARKAEAPRERIKLAVNKKIKREDPIIHKYSNAPRTPHYKEFFNLLEKYENFKENKKTKNEKIKTEKREATLQERLRAKRISNPHPNRRIPLLRRPAPPSVGMYDDIFNYKGI